MITVRQGGRELLASTTIVTMDASEVEVQLGEGAETVRITFAFVSRAEGSAHGPQATIAGTGPAALRIELNNWNSGLSTVPHVEPIGTFQLRELFMRFSTERIGYAPKQAWRLTVSFYLGDQAGPRRRPL